MLWTALLAPPITWMDPTQESTASEIASREIDPALSVRPLSANISCALVLSGRLGNCRVSHALDKWPVKLVSASHPSRTSGPPATLFPIGTGSAA